MPLSLRRSYLAGSVSALVLSATIAWAQETGIEPAAQPEPQNPETLIESPGSDTAAVGTENVGTAVQALVGMPAGDIEGMDIVNAADETIGEVGTVAENENGAIFLVVEIDEDVASAIPAGEHAVPLTAFDFNPDAQVLMLRDEASAAEAAYTVLDSDVVIEPFDVAGYGQPADEPEAGEAPATDDLAATPPEEPATEQDLAATEPEQPVAGEDQAATAPETDQDMAATEPEQPVTGEDQAATAPEEPATDQDLAATEPEQPATGEDLAATAPEEPATDQDMAASEPEQPVTGEDQAAAAPGEPATDQDMAATETGEEAAAQIEPSAGAEQGAPTTEEAVTATDDEAADEAAGNARQVLEEQGVASVEGLDILNPELEDVGTVEYVAQDASGKLYLIVSLDDGILGMGDSERVVALDAFDYLPEEESFVLLDVSEETLEAMQEWDTDNTQYTVIETDLDWTAYN
jgi:hypothetical protein